MEKKKKGEELLLEDSIIHGGRIFPLLLLIFVLVSYNPIGFGFGFFSHWLKNVFLIHK